MTVDLPRDRAYPSAITGPNSGHNCELVTVNGVFLTHSTFVPSAKCGRMTACAREELA